MFQNKVRGAIAILAIIIQPEIITQKKFLKAKNAWAQAHLGTIVFVPPNIDDSFNVHVTK